LCGLGEQVEHGAVLGLETAPFGRGQALCRDLERVQVEQGLLNPLELLLQPRAQRAHGGGGRGRGAYGA
jgi:hypothetical protein